MKQAGAEIHEATDFPSAEEIISPRVGREYAPEENPELSEFTVVKTEFYHDLQVYLSGLQTNPNQIKSLDDIVDHNRKHAEAEGGYPGLHPCWPSGQDNFEKSLASKGVMDETYHRALAYIRKKSREEGIDAALSWKGLKLDGLLVPVQDDGGAACQVAAKAGIVLFSSSCDE
ncbi:amidase [Emydomyces testavorans]|uniref:Amidase n=1 Tax=Emydomyces testavorans TaxID=2070801 RepID=A0AAF0DEM2_9EURO|nr:amidase [Emydomyces testavorans]